MRRPYTLPYTQEEIDALDSKAEGALRPCGRDNPSNGWLNNYATKEYINLILDGLNELQKSPGILGWFNLEDNSLRKSMVIKRKLESIISILGEINIIKH